MTSLCRSSFVLVALLAACAKTPPPPDKTQPPFATTATTKELMADVVEPAANVYWEAVGSITDKNGTVELAPKTQAQWDAVRNAAIVVAESGNLLMLDGRSANHGEWMELSRALIDVGKRARAAAEARDRTAVFDVGAEVYQACVNCHSKYMPGVATPLP
jgi:mono/diheme cytochrome c family protein